MQMSKLVFAAVVSSAAGSLIDVTSRRRGGQVLKAEAKSHLDEADQAAMAEMSQNKHFLLQALWEGRDLPDDKFQINDFADGEFARGHNEKKNVAVFGLQNSGVSLLNSMLLTNFGSRLNYFSADYHGGANRNTGFWKHSNFKELAKAAEKDKNSLQYYEDNEITTITVVRDPYSWLQAMRTDGNQDSPLANCAQGDDWLVTPCIHPIPGGQGTRIKAVPYQSLMGVWNHFNEGYLKAKQYGFQRNLVVTYEQLVRFPESFLDRLAKTLNIMHQGPWKMPLQSQISHERREAMENVGKKRYLGGFVGGERQKACFNLDADVQEFMKYGKYDCSKFDDGKDYKMKGKK